MADSQTFLDGLRKLSQADANELSFDNGWTLGNEEIAYLDYIRSGSEMQVNWSDELEDLHEESSRDHFLDVATRATLIKAIKGRLSGGGTVVDLGCSTGYLLEELLQEIPEEFLVGVDLIPEGLVKARKNAPGAALIRADVCDLPFQNETVDAVVSANLLEHVPDDVKALEEAFRVLKPGGIAAVVVPAGPGTYDYYDHFLGHERRYARKELASKAQSVGFNVLADSFIGTLIFPAFWLQKKVNRVRYRNLQDEDVHRLVSKDINRTQNSKIGFLASDIERRLFSRSVSMPFGIRSVVVLERAGF